jgi:hypothetical protein
MQYAESGQAVYDLLLALPEANDRCSRAHSFNRAIIAAKSLEEPKIMQAFSDLNSWSKEKKSHKGKERVRTAFSTILAPGDVQTVIKPVLDPFLERFKLLEREVEQHLREQRGHHQHAAVTVDITNDFELASNLSGLDGIIDVDCPDEDEGVVINDDIFADTQRDIQRAAAPVASSILHVSGSSSSRQAARPTLAKGAAVTYSGTALNSETAANRTAADASQATSQPTKSQRSASATQHTGGDTSRLRPAMAAALNMAAARRTTPAASAPHNQASSSSSMPAANANKVRDIDRVGLLTCVLADSNLQNSMATLRKAMLPRKEKQVMDAGAVKERQKGWEAVAMEANRRAAEFTNVHADVQVTGATGDGYPLHDVDPSRGLFRASASGSISAGEQLRRLYVSYSNRYSALVAKLRKSGSNNAATEVDEAYQYCGPDGGPKDAGLFYYWMTVRDLDPNLHNTILDDAESAAAGIPVEVPNTDYQRRKRKSSVQFAELKEAIVDNGDKVAKRVCDALRGTSAAAVAGEAQAGSASLMNQLLAEKIKTERFSRMQSVLRAPELLGALPEDRKTEVLGQVTDEMLSMCRRDDPWQAAHSVLHAPQSHPDGDDERDDESSE